MAGSRSHNTDRGALRVHRVRARLAQLLALGALLVTALAIPVAAAPSPAPSSPVAVPLPSDRIIVYGRPGAPLDAAARQVDATEIAQNAALGFRVWRVPVSDRSAAVARLASLPEIVAVEPDHVAAAQDQMPDDPFFPASNALLGGAWGWTKTRTTQAWDITRGDPSAVVAVLDTGLQDVADFAGQTVSGWNVLTNSTDTSANAGSHGTYVSGVVGLAVGNARGNAGYCPGCRIMPVQVGTDSGAYYSDLATGITWAADHGARVVNLSWAGPSASSVLTDAVAYARSKGVVVVAAAGNSNCDCPSYPAATPGVIGVAGTTSADAKQNDSNFGTWVDVAAPESNMTAWPSVNGAPGYAPVGGTSLAAPVAAAIAGLLFSYQPAASGTQVEQVLQSTAVPVPFAVQYGRVDALAALQSLGAASQAPVTAPVNVGPVRVLTLAANGADTAALSTAPQVGQVLTRGQGAWIGAAPLDLSAVQWQRCSVSGTSCTTVGSSAKYTVQTADNGYALRVLVTVRNALGATTVGSSLTSVVGGAPATTTTTVASTTTSSTSTTTSTTTTTTSVPATKTTTFSGSLAGKTPSRSYNVTTGSGTVRGALSFGCSSLTLAAKTSGRTVLGQASGPSVVRLDATTPAGTDTWTVTGTGKCAFTLTVTSPSP